MDGMGMVVLVTEEASPVSGQQPASSLPVAKVYEWEEICCTFDISLSIAY